MPPFFSAGFTCATADAATRGAAAGAGAAEGCGANDFAAPGEETRSVFVGDTYAGGGVLPFIGFCITAV